MALSRQSLTAAAKAKAIAARKAAEAAEQDLKRANRELDDAISEPRPDPGKVKAAHTRTMRAEKAVSEAAHHMEVVEVLLDAEGPGEPLVEHNLGRRASDRAIRELLNRPKPGDKP
jgi:hypothetical protein